MAHPATTKADSQLIADLVKLAKNKSKLVKSSLYPAPADPEIFVRSWKMNENKYYDVPSPFPSLARGIFTVEPGKKGKGSEEEDAEDGASAENADGSLKYRIVARGYDKFFNIGEVPWTNWPAIEEHTAGPYNLSLKSNGCIIFIGALTPSKLLITSKHSLGPVVGKDLSHAQAGEKWLRKYMADKGKTEEDLASVLWKNNWTAIAELCDDSFEEHVLPYAPDRTGLHLHGINECTKEFKTLPAEAVDDFAEDWGFIKTLSTTVNTIAEVRAFMAEAAKNGEWHGEAVEGFVVRTHVTEPSTVPAKGSGNKGQGKSPYAPGSSFFFKVKFDEPYMMYRDWREVTKMLLSSKGPLTEKSLPKSKMKRPETRLYVRWVIEEIKRDREPFAEFNNGKGIIAARERFLKWMESEKGQKDLVDAKESKDSTPVAQVTEFGKTIIVPVAIPGCGKTTVAVALAHIFGFGHTQSDDVHVKKAAPVFIKNVVALLKKHDVVIADKNNHLIQHRKQLRDATDKFTPPVRLLALNWSLDKPQSTVHRICGDRVSLRGDNHQTLRADSTGKAHEDVIWMFITTAQELTPTEVDVTIDMDLEESFEQSVKRAVDGCVRALGLERPSDEKIEEALRLAQGYAPKTKKPDDPTGSKKKTSGPRYFGLLAEVDLQEVIDSPMVADPDVDEISKKFWEQLKKKKRVAKRPHVTIVHSKALPAEVELWERCTDLDKVSVPPLFKFNLGHLVWNDRVMAATVDDLHLDAGEDADQKGHEFVSKLPDEVRQRLHITIGTRDEEVNPFEAKGLVEEWRKGDAGEGVHSLKLSDVVIMGRIKGMMG